MRIKSRVATRLLVFLCYYTHQRLTLRLTLDASTWCHHFGGTNIASPGRIVHTSCSSIGNPGKRLATFFPRGSTVLVLRCRGSVDRCIYSECSGLHRRHTLSPCNYIDIIHICNPWSATHRLPQLTAARRGPYLNVQVGIRVMVQRRDSPLRCKPCVLHVQFWKRY